MAKTGAIGARASRRALRGAVHWETPWRVQSIFPFSRDILFDVRRARARAYRLRQIPYFPFGSGALNLAE